MAAEDGPEAGDDGPELELARSLVREAAELAAFVAAVVEHRGALEPASYARAHAIFGKYQQQPQLLDPYLKDIVQPLLLLLRSLAEPAQPSYHADSSTTGKLEAVQKVGRTMYVLATVRGYKVLAKFFPVEASLLEPVSALLDRCHTEVSEVTRDATKDVDEEGSWQAEYTLLLWLAMLVQIPFDLATVDSTLTGREIAQPMQEGPPLAQRLIALCQSCLGSPAAVRDMAVVLLARLLTRRDMSGPLLRLNMVRLCSSFIACPFGGSDKQQSSVFLIPGIVACLSMIFKMGEKSTLSTLAPLVWKDVVLLLLESPMAERSPLLRRLLSKLLHRIALIHMPSRVAEWRYKRGSRMLEHNLIENATPVGGNSADMLAAEMDVKSTMSRANDELGDDTHVPEELEIVVHHLLIALRDKDTRVRWSAAKGLGRISARLSASLADDIVQSIQELFSASEGDGAWHGACLALAELARRGLLLPARLAAVIPLVTEALHYEVRRGAHSIGAHVRDAAAYVCWAFMRAYEPTTIGDYLHLLAPALLAVATCDREVNCRRAAAAAFQEGVGRQHGHLKHGMEIVTIVDYYNLSSVRHSCTSAAISVAQFPEFRLAVIEELLLRKTQHWSTAMREVAAEALALLVPLDPSYFVSSALDHLCESTLSPDLSLRHGALMALSHVLRALPPLSSERQSAVANVLSRMEKTRLLRGKGGELMREATCHFIASMAAVPLILSAPILDGLQQLLDENLTHPSEAVQENAAAALRTFATAYLLHPSPSSAPDICEKYLEVLKEGPGRRPEACRGAALALGALPSQLLRASWEVILEKLCKAARWEEEYKEQAATQGDAQTRVNAVRSIASVIQTLGIATDGQEPSGAVTGIVPVSTVQSVVVDTLLPAMGDYATDDRGDVGSWVRGAAVVSTERCLLLLSEATDRVSSHRSMSNSRATGLADADFNVKVVAEISKQAVEKLDKVRAIAGSTLQRIVHKRLVMLPSTPGYPPLELLIPQDTSINWAVAEDTFPRLVALLAWPDLRRPLLEGLVISAGGLTESVSKAATTALLQFLDNVAEPQSQGSIDIGLEFVHLLRRRSRCERVVLPAYKTINTLVTSGAVSIAEECQGLGGKLLGAYLAEVIQEELQRPTLPSPPYCGFGAASRAGPSIHVLLAAAPVLCQLLSCPAAVPVAVPQVLALLACLYPRVRSYCAEQLYLQLLTEGEESSEKLLEILAVTQWDAPLAELTHPLQTITQFLGS
eukprot:SM000019S04948  [mRNA]  locus=s19:155448:161920:- [translate_table: standard]